MTGNLPIPGRDTASITDHPFVPTAEWWTRCGCGLAEAAHASTTLVRDGAGAPMASRNGGRA